MQRLVTESDQPEVDDAHRRVTFVDDLWSGARVNDVALGMAGGDTCKVEISGSDKLSAGA